MNDIGMVFNKLFQIDKVSESVGTVNYREAVRAIIIKDKKILMVHSKNKDYKFPGGGIKKGEGNKLAWSLKEAKTNMFITEYLK